MKKALFAIPILPLILAACAPPRGAKDGAVDLTPPVLLTVTTLDPRTLALTFDEPPTVTPEACAVEPSLTISATAVDGHTIHVSFENDQEIGREYNLRLSVADGEGNGLWLLARFYGFNPSPPRLLINEFTTQGSQTHPDLVELKALTSGNLGGVTFFHGTASLYAYRIVLPALSVAPGDFILLHVKPEGLPEERDETGDKSSSGGRDASPGAYDFWIREGNGLSGNNGVISLYASPTGAVMDAVLYSTRTGDSDTTWRGFGSADMRDQADELERAGAWRKAGELIAPQDAVDPGDATATRSLCRSRDAADTNTRGDFHIVPTKKFSFGAENSDEVYVK